MLREMRRFDFIRGKVVAFDLLTLDKKKSKSWITFWDQKFTIEEFDQSEDRIQKHSTKQVTRYVKNNVQKAFSLMWLILTNYVFFLNNHNEERIVRSGNDHEH